MTNFNRGSEWRKWDLHVHTPSSVIQNYGGDTELVWEKYISDLEQLPEEFEVIGINDYNFIDGYEKILNFKNSGRLSNIKLILPVIELRLTEFGGVDELKSINYHVIFSNEFTVNDIKTNFINKLSVDILGDGTKFTINSKTKLAEYGQKLITEGVVNDDGSSNEKVGFNQARFKLEDIKNILETHFKGKYLTAIGKSEWESMRWSGAIVSKKNIINNTNFVFISSKNISEAINSKNKLIEQKVNSNLLHFSDSHYFSDSIGLETNILGKSFTWIKADPTFEGLKQIIYEPEERVKIQANKPEEKTGYQAIDKIIIKDCEYIEDSEIVFNQNLNTIIGGRSTGKSILLGAIAKKLKLEHTPDFETDYDNYIQSISDKIEIIWKDGTENNDREVEYFKQSYIYDLSKNRVKLNNIIEKILRQKGNEDEKDNSKELDNYNKFIFDNSKAISSGISDLFQILLDITKIKQIFLDLGDKSGVEKEIKKLNEELKRNSTIQITDEEKVEYEQLKKKLEDLLNNKNSNNNDFENIEKFKFNSFLKETIDYELISINDEGRKEVIKTFYIKLKEEFNEKWSLKIDEINKKISSDNLEIEKLIKEIIENSIYIKVTKAYTESVQLQEIEKKLKIQKEKLIQIDSIIKKIESLDKQKTELIKNIKDLYNKYQTESNIIVSKLSDKVDGLEIKSIIKIHEKKYKENLENSLNNINKENKSALISTSDKIFEVFDSLIEGNLFFKGGFNAESLSKKLMTENLYEIHYELIYEGDTFRQMSDGKKAFVVLKLLLDFSDKECPILIDQPEDDLDNRSICKELVDYLKKKKKKRQIIVATHNPNVVVTADAEEIIVANQNGAGSPNDNLKKFQYISGSLENTKILDKEILITSILKSQGIREHVCDIVEGGELAFEQRKKKYNF